MTNTIYFDLYRDDTSESTSPEVTEELCATDYERQPVSSSLYSVIGKAFSVWSFKRSGKFKQNNTDTALSVPNGNPHFSPSESILEVHPYGWNLPTPNLRSFTISELNNATKNFKSEFVLGEGGFGSVFKGWIDDSNLHKRGQGYAVAVKKLNLESMQGLEEWQSEVLFLGRLSHLNIVRLLGYCSEENELLLVYEYMQKGSLENHLFRRHSYVGLAWKLRLKIMLGAARGLAFLHSSENNIIYRDFKPSNILLDVNYNAKLSDFGLAKHGPVNDNTHVTTPVSGRCGYAAAEYINNGNSHVTTRVMGTYGYAAPEYIATGHLYVKSDVYGFGVVLLEILTGKRAIDANRPSGQHNLVDWLKPSLCNRRKLSNIIDPKLKKQYSSEAAKQTAELILKCIQLEPQNRPSMEEVIHSLEHIQVMESKSREVKNQINCSSSSSSIQSPEASQRHKSTIKSRVKGFRVSSFFGSKQKVVSIDGKDLALPSFYTSNFKNFSLKELKIATGNLITKDSLRVEDAYDREFKGWISEHDLTPTDPENGIAVVVKLLKAKTFGHCEDEAPYLGKLSHHPNLVKFFGHCLCLDEGQLFVFEFLPHTLGDYLFEWASLPLPWSLRMKVALGVAKGLAFLHGAQVIYRGLSTSNIHLDSNYNAKLSNFGLSKDCSSGDKSRAAPGYYATGHQTAKTDVYSFGILLLEMISGRQSSEFEEHDKTRLTTPNSNKKLEDEFIEEQHMVKCVRPYLDANVSHIVDHRLEGRYSLKSANKVAKLAFKCLSMEATMRPDMDQAVAELEQLQDSKYTKFIECEAEAMRKYKQFIESEMKLMGIEEVSDLSDTEMPNSQDMEDAFLLDTESSNFQDMEDDCINRGRQRLVVT